MLGDIFDFFPKGTDKIRPIQEEILKEIETQLDMGTKFIIIEAPTGVGKSDVNVTTALYKKGGTVLTTQKILQDQYDESFNFVRSVKGKNHFPCHQKDDLENCEQGICVFPNGKFCKHYVSSEQILKTGSGTMSEVVYLGTPSKKPECGYYLQRRIGEQASFAVYNYPKYLTTYLEDKEDDRKSINQNQKKILVCDEAHNLESQLADFGTLELSTEDGKKCDNEEVYNDFREIKNYWEDVKKTTNLFSPEYETKCNNVIKKANRIFSILKHSYYEKIVEIEDEIKELLGGPSQTTMDMWTKDFNEFSEIEKNFAGLNKMREDLQLTLKEWNSFEIDGNDNFVLGSIDWKENKTDGTEEIIISLKPIFVKEIAKKLFSTFDHVIFTSSTIHEKFFKRELGIEDAFYKSYPSPFKIENRPIYYDSKISLNYKNNQIEIPKIKNHLNNILNQHKSEKGIIHVTSYDYQKLVLSLLEGENKNRVKPLKTGQKRDDWIKEHQNSKENSVLISPSIWEGIDLPDDQSRFQIIFKAPYLTLSDLRIKKKKEHEEFGNEWYYAYSTQKLVQGCGRSIRNQNDFAKTYMIDSKCYNLAINGPEWFKKSLEPNPIEQ
jgi:Rad3-related DNA helicase